MVGILTPAATEGLIESDDAADFLVAILDLGLLGGQKRLLGCEDFEVVHGRVLHQAFGLLDGLLQGLYAFFTYFQTLAGGLPGCERIVDLGSGIQEFLAEANSAASCSALAIFRLATLAPLLNKGWARDPAIFNKRSPGLTTIPPPLFVQPAAPERYSDG